MVSTVLTSWQPRRLLGVLLLAVLILAVTVDLCEGNRRADTKKQPPYQGIRRLAPRDNTTDAQCRKHTSCNSCTDSDSCVWCSKDGYCTAGGFGGANCDGWMYRQCVNDGLALVVGVGIIVALVILITLAIIFCCIFCRRSAASYEVMDDDVGAASTTPTSVNSHPITDQHRADMEAKYGLSSLPPPARADIDS
jgi:hypothetical protein